MQRSTTRTSHVFPVAVTIGALLGLATPAARAQEASTSAGPAPALAATAEVPTIGTHILGVGFGYGRYATLDEAASRLAYGANAVVGTLDYTGESRTLRWAVRTYAAWGNEQAKGYADRTIRFQSQAPDGTIDDVTVPMRGTRLVGSAEAQLDYVHRFAHVDLFAGGGVGFVVQKPDGFVMPGLQQRLVFEPVIGVRWRFAPRQQLELEARTALFGWVTRLPYHQSVSWPDSTAYQGLVEQGSGFRTIADFQTFDALASYRLRVRSHLALRGTTAVTYVHDPDPRPLRAFNARFLLSFDVVFGGR